MLTSLSLAGHMARNSPEAPYPWEGSEHGEAADGQNRTALTIQQEVPNIGEVQTAPKTQVNPTHEQGWGRAPGWQWGWMRKNIPFNLAFGRNGVKRLGQIRPDGGLNLGMHRPGVGKWQQPGVYPKPRRGVLAAPQTAYLTAAVSPVGSSAGAGAIAGSWGEPPR